MDLPTTKLSVAVSLALKKAPLEAPVSYEDISKLAELALAVNENIIGFLADQKAIPSNRQFLVTQLIRASFDHGRALLFLLQTNPRDMGASSFALHRAQLEAFLRAIYLGYVAEDYQVQDFIDNEKIRFKNGKEKWENIGVVRLAELVQEKINELSDEELEDPAKFTRMVADSWESLCGFVHGGRAITVFYEDTDGSVGCSTPPSVLFQCVCNSFVVTNFGFITVLAKIYDLPGILHTSDLYKAMTKFMHLQRSLAKRPRGDT